MIEIVFLYIGKFLQHLWVLLNTKPAVVIIATVLLGFGLHWLVKRRQKRDAARIILQEIRVAEELFSKFKEDKNYKLYRKIIPTNSWDKYKHLFVKDFEQNQLDKVGCLFSTGEYLDSIVKKISDYKFENSLMGQRDGVKIKIQGIKNDVANKLESFLEENVELSPEVIRGSKQINRQKIVGFVDRLSPYFYLTAASQVPTAWDDLLTSINNSYEPIYHSTICEKLKKIAKLK